MNPFAPFRPAAKEFGPQAAREVPCILAEANFNVGELQKMRTGHTGVQNVLQVPSPSGNPEAPALSSEFCRNMRQDLFLMGGTVAAPGNVGPMSEEHLRVNSSGLGFSHSLMPTGQHCQ